MDLHLGANVIQNLVILITLLMTFAIVGLKRGWIGQAVTLTLIISLWSLFSLTGDTLIKFANNIHKGVFFLALCGTEEDPFACLESSGIMQKILVDPQEPAQVRLFFLVIFVCALAVAYLLVVRFGKLPRSIWQKLIGTVMGVVNGFILSYLLLPFTAEQLPLLPPLEAGRAEGFEEVARLIPGFTTACHVGVPFIVVILFVLFVIVAVRFARPPKQEQT